MLWTSSRWVWPVCCRTRNSRAEPHAQVAAFHVFQDHGGQIQNSQVVGQRGPVQADLVGQGLDGEVGVVNGPFVGPDHFDLRELLPLHVLGQGD